MEYKDNPRKIHGKVEVVYSDSDISTDIVTKTNGDAAISHPHEVFGEEKTPTVKACTMDGNSTMDGTFQMMDDTVFCGWWGKELSDEYGEFLTAPCLELSFVLRPIISWIVLGDEKLNEFPVDFTIEYLNGKNIVDVEQIIGNKQLEVRLTPIANEITAIRLIITKWSKPKACVKILNFYDRLSEIYEGNAIQYFEVNEEMCSADGNYNINSDTMTVSLLNDERKFDKGYLRSLMILNRKLIPYIGIERNGVLEYTKLGTFYSDEWELSQDSQWVKCRAVDNLLCMQTKMYVGFPVVSDISLYEIAVDILEKTGVFTNRYVITEKLKDIIVPIAYLPKMSAWDALQEIANAGLCKIFMDREDRINIVSDGNDGIKSDITINTSNMFTFSSNITLTEFANRIAVEYCDIIISDDIIETASVDITLDRKEKLEMVIDYTADCAYSFIVSNNENLQLTEFISGVNACTVIVENNTDVLQTAKLTVSGNAIEISTKKITKQDEKSVRNAGVTEFAHPASELIQSLEHAEYIASLLLSKMSAGEGVVICSWRGNPNLHLGDIYTLEDRFGDTTRFICENNKFSYDGGLKQESRGRKIFNGG